MLILVSECNVCNVESPYSLIYPYISYAILAWGSAYKTHIDKVQTKQNHSARLISLPPLMVSTQIVHLPC